VPTPSVEPNAIAVAPCHQAKSIVFDLGSQSGPFGGFGADVGRQGSMKPNGKGRNADATTWTLNRRIRTKRESGASIQGILERSNLL
jgi:hypothetical protein